MKKNFRRILFFVLALAAVLIIDVPAFAQEKSKDYGKPPKELANISQEEWDVLRYTNIQRAKAGLPMLVTFDIIQNAAGTRAEEIVSVFSHYRPDGSGPNTALKELGYTYSIFGENIAFGQRSAYEVVKAWMNSEGHRANILNEMFLHMGVGYKDKNWVQIFATNKNSEAVSIEFNEELGYFKLILKSGVTAYAPYDSESSPVVDGKVTFNYPGLKETDSIMPADGWYNFRIMYNYVNLDYDDKAELRDKFPFANMAYYVENKGNNQITLKIADGRYLGIEGNIANGVQLKAVSNPYLWKVVSENNNDIFSLRPTENTEMVVNASGESNKDGTKIILWAHADMNAPNHAEIRFIPTSAPEEPEFIQIDAPGSLTVKKASATSVKCTWKAVSDADGYEIYYSTSKNGTFKKAGSTTSKLTYTKKSLKEGKSYYFKVRAYKTINGEKVYGEFSKVKSIKL